MNTDLIVMILTFVLTVAVFAWGLYERVKGNAAASASAFIAEVESSDLLGKDKMAKVVGWLYDLVPAPFKKFLTKETLEVLAQKIFDYMKKYTYAYIETHNEDGNRNAYHEVTDELAGEVIHKLTSLGAVGLRTLAANMGIDTEGKDDETIIKEIVVALLEKS